MSEHPQAAAILEHAAERKVELVTVSGFDSVTCKGVLGEIGGRHIILGNAWHMQDVGINFSTLKSQAQVLREQGQTVMQVGMDGAAAALIAVADPLKASTTEAIAQLRKAGARITANHASKCCEMGIQERS